MCDGVLRQRQHASSQHTGKMILNYTSNERWSYFASKYTQRTVCAYTCCARCVWLERDSLCVVRSRTTRVKSTNGEKKQSKTYSVANGIACRSVACRYLDQTKNKNIVFSLQFLCFMYVSLSFHTSSVVVYLKFLNIFFLCLFVNSFCIRMEMQYTRIVV